MTSPSVEPVSGVSSKTRGALFSLCIGDALAMPVHWYYDRRALVRDYGRVVDFLPPRNPHPDSILWRSEYRAPNRRGEILHDQAAYWGQRNIHYHQFLRAGENTLNIKIARLLMDSLMDNGRYRPDDFLRRAGSKTWSIRRRTLGLSVPATHRLIPAIDHGPARDRYNIFKLRRAWTVRNVDHSR